MLRQELATTLIESAQCPLLPKLGVRTTLLQREMPEGPTRRSLAKQQANLLIIIEGQKILKRFATLATSITVASGAWIMVIRKVDTEISTTQSIPLRLTILHSIFIRLITRFNNFFAISAGTKSLFGNLEEIEKMEKMKRSNTIVAIYTTRASLPRVRVSRNRLLFLARPIRTSETTQVISIRQNTPIHVGEPIPVHIRSKVPTAEEQNPLYMEITIVNTKKHPTRIKKVKIGLAILTRRQGPIGKITSVMVFVIIFVSKAATVAPGVLKCLTDLTITSEEVSGVVKVVVSFVFVLVVSNRPRLFPRTRA